MKNSESLKKLGCFFPFQTLSEFNLFTLRLFECFFQNKNPHECKEIKDLLAKISNTPLNLIYSSEHLGSFTQHIDKLAKVFNADNYKVILYIRRADYYFESLYNQLVRNYLISGRESIEDHIDFFNLTESNRYFTISKWAEVFNKKNITVLPYRENQGHKEIYFRFFQAMNLSLTDDFIFLSSNRNISLPKKLLPLLQEVNRRFYSSPEKAHYIKSIITNAYHHKDFSGINKETNFLSYIQREKIINASRHWDEKIAKEYLNEEHLFDYTIPYESRYKDSELFTQKEVEELVINTLGFIFDEHNK